MLEILQIVGLAIIASGWILQLLKVLNGNRMLHEHFLSAYIAGSALFVIGSKARGLDFVSIFSISSIIVATIIFIKTRKQ